MKVAYHPLVIDFLEELTFALYEKGYFGFYDSACEYVDRMVDDISSNIYLNLVKKLLRILINWVKICSMSLISPTPKLPGIFSLTLRMTVI